MITACETVTANAPQSHHDRRKTKERAVALSASRKAVPVGEVSKPKRLGWAHQVDEPMDDHNEGEEQTDCVFAPA